MKKRLFITLLMALMVPFMMQAQQKAFVTLDTAVCGSFTWSANGQTYTQSGLYTFSDESNNYALNLVVYAEYTTPQPVNISGVCSYRFGNKTFYTDTVYADTLRTRVGNCDSVVALSLTVANLVSNAYEVTSCGPFYWAASKDTLTQNGVYNCTRVDSLRISGNNYKRCDSVLTLTLSIMDIDQRNGYDTVVGCDKVLFKFREAEVTYLTFYRDTNINSNDRYAPTAAAWPYFHKRGNTPDQCYDTISNVHIIVKKSSVRQETVYACDSYTFTSDSWTYETLTRYDTIAEGVIDTVQYIEGTNTPISAYYIYTTMNQKFYLDTNAVGCSDSLYLDINISPSPVAYIDGEINLLPNNNGTTLYATCNQEVSYQWYKDGSAIAGATLDSLTTGALTANTDYALIVRTPQVNNFSCYDTTMVTVTVNEGIVSTAETELSLYPNPASELVSVACDEEIASIAIYNTLGQRVIFSNSANSTLNVRGLAAGNYAMRIETKSGKVVVRNLVIAR